uniref:type III restriction-modification system endonuclease n=1 Tax=Arthrobacter sp. TaxID=1667 RepID=UPI000EB66C22|nr:type III restriction-modification system endonuclease [Arthrobacter sp.]AXV46554.1 endonuclease, type III restriction-modification system StyLTI enzyme res [Arthrobacter sp.]
MSSKVEIRLQELEHQISAVNAVIAAFNNVNLSDVSNHHANPSIAGQEQVIAANILQVQSGKIEGLSAIPSRDRSIVQSGPLGIDVKMETGTGKTYTYTRLMYELHQRFGFHKFVLLVPTAPIRSGTEEFIYSDYAKSHFADLYENSNLKLEVLKAQKRTKGKGRSMLPRAIEEFATGTRLNEREISALMMTGAMLTSKVTMGTSFDQTLLSNLSTPYEIIAATRPIVIIDEPHRFSRGNAQFKTLLEKIDPQLIIRFGATYPRVTQGRGKTKSTVTDFDNLVYDLNAVESFNRNLVKGIQVDIPEVVGEASQQFKLSSISSQKPKSATFVNATTKDSVTIAVGEMMTALSPDFSGITLEDIRKLGGSSGQTGVVLSNGYEISKSDRLVAGTFSLSYQKIMLEQAIKNHFEKEWENFDRPQRIKTLSLFFIDSVYSYRTPSNESGPLRLQFEELLKKYTLVAIEKHKTSKTTRAQEYVSFLQASLNEISLTSAGYFSQDNSTKNEAIEAEVTEILRDKRGLLAFTRDDGSWHTRRFIFSKWTLREGWDNPNVFQIAKLRSSGSEISKLQEIGRGLRLPVDESGTRLATEQHYLTYLVDGSERGFTTKLLDEINADVTPVWNVEDKLKEVAERRGVSEDALHLEMLMAGFIDRHGNVHEDKHLEFEAAYPDFERGLRPGKVADKKDSKSISIRKKNFEFLADLWKSVNKKYVVTLEALSSEELDAAVDEILDKNLYEKSRSSVMREQIVRNDKGVLEVRAERRDDIHTQTAIPYGRFLKHVHEATKLPVDAVHRGLIRLNAKTPLASDFFNHRTLARLSEHFQEWFKTKFETRYNYQSVEHESYGTALTEPDGSPKDSILMGRIGKFVGDGASPSKFLFDEIVYDSDLEHTNIVNSGSKALDDKIIVYGKIPTRSIRVPLYFGGTTSPDFMYVLAKPNGALSINLIVESKSVMSIEEETSKAEQRRIAAAEKFFAQMKEAGADIVFKSQARSKEVIEMIEEML